MFPFLLVNFLLDVTKTSEEQLEERSICFESQLEGTADPGRDKAAAT